MDMPHGATERVAVAVLERVGEVERVAVFAGLGQLARHGRFWLVVFAMATPLGVYAAWLNVLDINLQCK